MIMSMKAQTLLFLSTAGVGALMAFIFDIFRILRRVFKHPNFLTYIEDALFWLVVSFLMFYHLLVKSYGEIRFFSILGSFLGALIYFLAVSNFVLTFSVTVINFFKKVLAIAIKIILFPIKIVLKALSYPLGFVYRIFRPIFAAVVLRLKKLLQKSKTYVKIKSGKALKEINIIIRKV